MRREVHVPGNKDHRVRRKLALPQFVDAIGGPLAPQLHRLLPSVLTVGRMLGQLGESDRGWQRWRYLRIRSTIARFRSVGKRSDPGQWLRRLCPQLILSESRIIVQTGEWSLTVPPGVKLLRKPYPFSTLVRKMKGMQAISPMPLFLGAGNE